MKQIFLYLTVLTIGLCCSCKDKTVDNIASIDQYYIKNSFNIVINYEFVGLSEDRANRLGYTNKGQIQPNTTVKVFEMRNTAVAGYEFDTIKICNQNNEVLYKVGVPYPLAEKCKIEKIDETTSKWTLDVNVNLLN